MNWNKKLLSALLATGMLVSLAACGSSAAEGAADSAGDVVEIEYWHINSETFAGPETTQLIEQFNATHPDIKVTEKFSAGDYLGVMQNIQSAYATQQPPDLVQIGWSYREYFAENFAYTTPEDLIAEFGTEADQTFVEDNFTDEILALAVSNAGDVVGFPYGLSVPVIYVNEDILAEAGVSKDDLGTWPDVREAAKKIQEATGKYGLYIAEWGYTWEVQSIIESNGGAFITDGLSSIYSPEAVEAYQLYADMVLEDKSALHAPASEGTQAFVSGEVGMYMESIGMSTTVISSSAHPVSNVAAPGWEGKDPSYPSGGNFLAVTSTDPEKKAATLELVKFLYEAESIDTWYGATGYIPPIRDAETRTSLMQDNPILQVAVDCLPYTVPWAGFPGTQGLEVEQILINNRDRILGGADVDTALKETQDQINALYE